MNNNEIPIPKTPVMKRVYLDFLDRDKHQPWFSKIGNAIKSTANKFLFESEPEVGEEEGTLDAVYGTYKGEPIYGPVDWTQFYPWNRVGTEFQQWNQRFSPFPMSENVMQTFADKSLYFIRKLAEGGQGQVWLVKANRLVTDRRGNYIEVKLACKIMSLYDQYKIRSFRGVESCVKMLMKEANIMSELRHRNIIKTERIFKVFDEVSGFPKPIFVCILMELMDGDLESLIFAKKRITLQTTKNWFKQIAHGLRYLHKKNVVHLDIKPPNILYKTYPSGVIVFKLTDFGIGYKFQPNDSGFLEVPMGTPGYEAPEVYSIQYLPKPCDIYSLGITLAQSLSSDYKTLLEDVKQWTVNRSFELNRKYGFTTNMANLVQLMTCDNPNQRPTARNICNLIENFDFDHW